MDIKQQLHFTLSDDAFENEMRMSTLKAEWFTHVAHIRIAWIHIIKYGIEYALDNVCSQIKNFANANGARDKFNLTVSAAAVYAVNHFIKRTTANNFLDFIQQNPQLINNLKGLLATHYSQNIFETPEAKSTFIQPDLSPFN